MTSLLDLLDDLASLGTNHAPIPVAIAYENNTWTIDIDVRLKRNTIDFTYTDPDLSEAIRKAHHRLRRETR